jgi:hypothetical protein
MLWHMQSATLLNHVIVLLCMLCLLFWTATVSPVDEWRTVAWPGGPSGQYLSTGQRGAPRPGFSRDYCGGGSTQDA